MAQDTQASSDIGIHSLDHFALGVPDVGDARRFYGGFGLDVRDEPGALGLYAGGHRWGVVQPASRKHLAWVSFGAYAHDVSRIEERLRGLGIATLDRKSVV